MAPKKKYQPENFEAAMAELEVIVQQLERGELPLTEALETFQKGVALTQYCQKTLAAAEKTVSELIESQGDFVLDDQVN